ncbi:hypothetical protein ACIPRD_08230 [Streptomyces sp. NPDC090108]|uniref:hypothetical protein n=1 Tax=Streptomyces sp. NPDC090108 TaxID=3365947 RepID=UPI00381B75F4
MVPSSATESAFCTIVTSPLVGTAVLSVELSKNDIVTDVDVLTGADRPTVAVLGDHLVDPFADATSAGLSTPRLADDLGAALRANTLGVPDYGVVASGIENNRMATEQDRGGPAVLTRLDRDVLDLPGITTVVVDTGLEDIVAGTDDTTLENSYGLLRDQLRAWGIKVVFTTLTPCDGYVPCTAAVDANRTDTNTWITDQSDFTTPTVGYVDAEEAVAVPDPASTADPPVLMLNAAAAPADLDVGDHVNLSRDGYQGISDAFDLTTLGPDA